jgi:hypothetical protein
MLTASDVALIDNLNLEAARLAVWATHNNRCGLVAVEFTMNRNIPATPASVQDLGRFYSVVFRQQDRDCFFCGSADKQRGLCPSCYPQLMPPTTKEAFEAMQRYDVQSWRQITADRCECVKCRATFSVPAGVIYDRLAAGKAWTTPKWCRACWTSQAKPRWQTKVITPAVKDLLNHVDQILGEGEG